MQDSLRIQGDRHDRKRNTLRAALWSRLGRLAYGSRALPAYHRAVNAGTLTVAMFHRILPPSDPLWKSAHPTWTLSSSLFEECLDFFLQHYTVVSIADVLESVQSHKHLPSRALLLTFDDGWADNELYALKPLQQRRLPAVVFMVSSCIDGDECWHEPLLRAWHAGRISREQCERVWEEVQVLSQHGNGIQTGGMEALVLRLSALSEEDRRMVLRSLPSEVRAAQKGAMLTKCQLGRLSAAGVAIQSHGKTHLPMGALDSPSEELGHSKEMLSLALGRDGASNQIFSMSFPHGSYDADVVRHARSAGYHLLFTSDAVLNACGGGRPNASLLGRIPIIASEITAPGGRLDVSRLARWLFLRPIRALSAC